VQAEWCDRLGSPFTARLCRLLAERLTEETPVASAILAWAGDPVRDALALRVAGALHYLARGGSAAALKGCYPPHTTTDEQLWSAVAAALAHDDGLMQRYLETVVQTNEVMRSAALLPGLLVVAEATGVPLHLFEIGSSAGLNLILDRYGYRFGEARWGNSTSEVQLQPSWSGASPPVAVPLDIRTRRGADLNPVDTANDEAQRRLLSYVWPDQPQRLQRLDAAIATMAAEPVHVERSDAADWIEKVLPPQSSEPGARVLFHSITWSYLSGLAQGRLTGQMQRCAQAATRATPFAWLRFELGREAAELRLNLWPGGADQLLAVGDPHGSRVTWLAAGREAIAP
jgi:hypothetical protein